MMFWNLRCLHNAQIQSESVIKDSPVFMAFCKRKHSDLWLSDFKIGASVAMFVNSYLQKNGAYGLFFMDRNDSYETLVT